MHVRKPSKHISPPEFVPWTTASFRTKGARDQFLHDVATLPAQDVESGPALDENRNAMVRWRPGHFLGLNDVAYAHGGRIAVVHRRGTR